MCEGARNKTPRVPLGGGDRGRERRVAVERPGAMRVGVSDHGLSVLSRRRGLRRGFSQRDSARSSGGGVRRGKVWGAALVISPLREDDVKMDVRRRRGNFR